MQTSLERRERRRRNGNSHRRGGTGAGRAIAIALPLLLLTTLVTTGFVAFAVAIEQYNYYSQGLQDPMDLLQHIDYNQQTVLYDRTGTVELARYGSEHRRLLTFAEIPAKVIDATTSAEDKTFWTNTGFDPMGAVSAFYDSLRGRPRGASTITQQLVRAKLLPPTNTLTERKIKEIIQSIRLTQEYSGLTGKQDIVTAYLNLNFFGNQSYGVAAAAEGYFGVKDLNQLTLAQAAILAGILQAPSDYDLMANAEEQPDGSLVVPADSKIAIRRNWVLDQMAENQKARLLSHAQGAEPNAAAYSDAEIEAAKAEPIVLHPAAARQNLAPQFDEQVKRQLASLFCPSGTDPNECESIDTGGYKVITTIDLKMQASAEKWLKAYIFAPNQGSKQATIDYLAKLGITAKSDPFNYYRIVGPAPDTGNPYGLRNRDIHNGALIGLDYRTGQVLAYAGSAGFYEKPVKNPKKAGANLFDPQFDVLTDGWRQPGSSFKPINYVTAIEDRKLTAASLFMDVATDFGGGYKPHDADGLERGPIRLRNALQFSYNIPAVKTASINGVDHLMQRAEDFGLTFPPGSTPGVSLGIGTVEVHPADLASAYGAIANGGSLVQRTMILSIADSKGNQIWPQPGQKVVTKKVISAQAAYVMTNILAGNTNVAENWWWGQYALTANGVRRPATLKTGTSDQTEDLFAGGWVAQPKDTSKPAVVAIAWAGNSDRSAGQGTMSLELTAPIWRNFMLDATAGTPVVDFAQPSGVSWVTIDANSGMLPGPYTSKTYREVFINGTAPSQRDNTKVAMDVQKDTGKLWAEGCTGDKQTKGFLDLSQIDAGNASWQRFDAMWIDRARKGVGVRGGPNGGPTAYFYDNGWGASFAPDKANPDNYCSIEPSPSPTPSGSGLPSGSPGPSPTTGPTQSAPPTSPPTKPPTPAPTKTKKP